MGGRPQRASSASRGARRCGPGSSGSCSTSRVPAASARSGRCLSRSFQRRAEEGRTAVDPRPLPRWRGRAAVAGASPPPLGAKAATDERARDLGRSLAAAPPARRDRLADFRGTRPTRVTRSTSRRPTSECSFTARARRSAASRSNSNGACHERHRTSCQEFVEEVTNYLEGKLSEAEARWTDEHLAQCALPRYLADAATIAACGVARDRVDPASSASWPTAVALPDSARVSRSCSHMG